MVPSTWKNVVSLEEHASDNGASCSSLFLLEHATGGERKIHPELV
jgi:hypothetical protein